MRARTQTERIHYFGEFAFDEEGCRLYRGQTQVKLQPQPLKVLAYLVQRAPDLVSREELRGAIWPDVNVDLDLSLNYCIRQIRCALDDSASYPRFVETLPKQGYRFIARIDDSGTSSEQETLLAQEPSAGQTPSAGQESSAPQTPAGVTPTSSLDRPLSPRTWSRFLWPGVLLTLCGAAGLNLYYDRKQPAPTVGYEQLTDFNGSVRNPVLSPDGRLLAFMRGDAAFGTSASIYVKILPNGDPKLISDDPRPKYNLAFSPDASRIAYTVWNDDDFSTFSVPTLGGDARLLLKNAAGLTWLAPHQYLFSRLRSGLHLGIVTTNDTGDDPHELYYPQHERGMAHYSFASPSHASAIVVEMDEQGRWAPCKLIDLNGAAPARAVGPPGPCTYAGWSPDGATMYFIATVDGHSHLWSQSLSGGTPQQILNDPSEEEGLAVEASGRSVITSIGVQESAIWIHSPAGDHALSSEGQVIADPAFSRNDRSLYFLLQQRNTAAGPELWRSFVDSGRSEPILPGVAMTAFHIAPDESKVVYTADEDKASQLWISPLDGSSRPHKLNVSAAISPHFGPQGKILFVHTEGNANFLEQVNQDGSGRARISSEPIIEILSISPGQRWLILVVPGNSPGDKPGIAAFDLHGGPLRRLFAGYCVPQWSSDGKLLSIPVEPSSPMAPGRSLVIPLGPGESLPALPREGLRASSGPTLVPGSRFFARADFIPGKDLSEYAYVQTREHRNLFRVTLPGSPHKSIF